MPYLLKIALIISLATGAKIAMAETRVAFVVGNSEYEHTSPLRNPVNDAQAISQTLRDLDFTVSEHYDLTRNEMTRALSEFLSQNEQADVTLFYFAGHGMQFEGRNYLIGTDARLQSEFDVDSEALDLGRVTQMLERQSRAALIFVDACRNNPLADNFYQTNFSETRATMSRGLAPVQSTSEGSMVVFSAAPGQVAQDGSGTNSPFAQALVDHLATENAEVLSLMKRVIRDVKIATADAQVPMVTNDLVTEIYLKLGEGGAGASLAFQQEEVIFEAALAIGTQRAWDIYLTRYPNGNFREIALNERERLGLVRMAAASGTTYVEGDEVSVSADVAESVERSLGLSRDDAVAVQEALNELGYNVGAADGVIGAGTRRGISAFQSATGLPVSGVVTAATAEKLGITLAEFETGAASVDLSTQARRFDVDQLALLEDDERLLNAVRALSQYELVYGFFEGKVYIVPSTWGMSYTRATELAESVGGYVAAVNSPEEQNFIYDLIKDDTRLWRIATSGTTSFGPWIGLSQPEGAREPDGGFRWSTGESVTYTNWAPGFPKNHGGRSNHAAFISDRHAAGVVTPGPEWCDIEEEYPANSVVIEIE